MCLGSGGHNLHMYILDSFSVRDSAWNWNVLLRWWAASLSVFPHSWLPCHSLFQVHTSYFISFKLECTYMYVYIYIYCFTRWLYRRELLKVNTQTYLSPWPYHVTMPLFYSVDLFLRLISWKNMLKFLTLPMHIMDILSILPFFIGLFADLMSQTNDSNKQHGYVALRVCRTFRIIRIFKFVRHSKELIVVMKVSVLAALTEIHLPIKSKFTLEMKFNCSYLNCS